MTNETSDRELVLTRLIDAPPDKVYRAWTEPTLLQRWFAPAPWTTPHAELDVWPGGASKVVMRSPDGNDMPCPGVYLEVVPNRRLVFTDAYTSAWQPSTQNRSLPTLPPNWATVTARLRRRWRTCWTMPR